MSLWTRGANMFRLERVNREIDEELESHVLDGHRKNNQVGTNADFGAGLALRRRALLVRLRGCR